MTIAIDVDAMLLAQDALQRNPEKLPTRKQRAALEALERLRMEAAAEIEKLIDWLDKTLPDPDLEQSLGGAHFAGAHLDYEGSGLDHGEDDGLLAGELCESENEADLSTPESMWNQEHATRTSGWREGEQDHVIVAKVDAVRRRARRPAA